MFFSISISLFAQLVHEAGFIAQSGIEAHHARAFGLSLKLNEGKYGAKGWKKPERM